MDPNQPPTLEHGIPDPEIFLPDTETILPGIPDWYLWYLVGGIILTILAILWLVKLLFRRPEKDRAVDGHDFFTPASESLKTLESECESKLVSEIAAEASLAIRTYLAGSQSEPALYETAEEFQARQSVLPAEANSHLNKLNNAKYSKSEINEARSLELVRQSEKCLEKLRSFFPRQDDAPPLLIPEIQETHWFRRVIAKRAKAGVPLGGIFMVVGLLGGTYQQRDTGPQIHGNSLVWVGLSISVIALLIHFTVRENRSRS